MPMMASTMADLNLAMAAMFQDLNVPSALVPSVLSFAMQEFIYEVSGAGGDWRRLLQLARNLRRQRVEDYVSATSAVDGPLVPEEDPGSPGTH